MAHYEDLVIDQGTDVRIEVHLVNPDKSIKNLTGYTVAAKMAPSYDAVDSDKIPFTASVLSPAGDGKILLALSSAQSDLLNARKRYVYDVEITHNDGINDVVERVLEGKITVTPSVT
jgi:hypothetical protein